MVHPGYRELQIRHLTNTKKKFNISGLVELIDIVSHRNFRTSTP